MAGTKSVWSQLTLDAKIWVAAAGLYFVAGPIAVIVLALVVR